MAAGGAEGQSGRPSCLCLFSFSSSCWFGFLFLLLGFFSCSSWSGLVRNQKNLVSSCFRWDGMLLVSLFCGGSV